MLELPTTESFVCQLQGENEAILFPVRRARRHRRDVQKVQPVGERPVGAQRDFRPCYVPKPL
jgi:hypothetical protein